MGDTPEVIQKEIDIDIPLIVLVLLFVLLTFFPFYKQHGSAIKLKMQRLLNRSSHVVILSTYGPSVEGSPFYEAYVKKAVRYMMDPANKVNELIIVGGYTVDPDRSQSQAVLDYMMQKYPEFGKANIPVTLDECGITTWQNMKNAKRLADKEFITPGRITVFAEETRKERVFLFSLSEFFLKNDAIKKLFSSEAIKGANESLALPIDEQLRRYESSPHNTVVPRDPQNYKDIELNIITESAQLPKEIVDAERLKVSSELKEMYEPTYGNAKIKQQLDEWTKIAGFDTAENLVKKGCAEYKQYLDK